MSRWLGLAVPPLLAILLGLAVNNASETFPEGFRTVAWPALVVLAVVAVWLEVARGRAADATSAEERLRTAADALARAVKQQWVREAALRGLREPWVLPQPWATTDRPVTPPATAVRGVPDPVARPWWKRLLRRSRVESDHVIRGEVDELVGTVLGLPHRQVAVLGEPGAGKTVLAIQFTLALLARRVPGMPVPVLLSVSSWRVGEEPLLDWMRNQLRADYPELAVGLLDLLVDDPELVFPVLDGMDELPRALHGQAIREIDLACAGRPLLLTCRSREYEDAVDAAGSVLATALVVELGPVGVDDVITYLSTGRVAGDPRWAPLFENLRRAPAGPLATALRTPLMIGLARTMPEPAELLAFADHERVERCLLDRFLGNVYPDDPRAASWLRTLAVHLRQERTYDLAWWHLYRMRRSTTRMARAGAGVVGAALAGAAVWLIVSPTVTGESAGPVLGTAAGLLAGIATGWAVRLRPDAEPGRVTLLLRGRWLPLAGQLSGGVVRGTAIGIGIGVVAEATYIATFNAFDPSFLGLLLGAVSGAVTGLAYGLAAWLQGSADTVHAASPRVVLRADRTAKLVQLIVFGLAFGLAVTLVTGLVADLDIAAIDGAGAALLGMAVGLARGPHLWMTFLFARLGAARRGELPFRLMSFLDDAHRRGVLRANGGSYQFRHGLLQDHLAGGTVVPADAAEPVTSAPSRSRVRRASVLVVVSVVAGLLLGAGLPVAGGLQTRCGVTPFDANVRYLRVGLDSECVGVTDGSYVFDDEITLVSKLIAAENQDVRDSDEPYVRMAMLMPLVQGVLSRTEIRHALEGAYVALHEANRRSPVNVELVLANSGSKQRHWEPVVMQLRQMATEEHPLVAAIDSGVRTEALFNAATLLSLSGIETISATPAVDEFSSVLAAALERRTSDKPRHLISVRTDSDVYVQTLSSGFRQRYRGEAEELFFDQRTGPMTIAGRLCSDGTTVLFSGRTEALGSLVDAIALRCPRAQITIAAGTVDVARLSSRIRMTAVRVLYVSAVDTAQLRADGPYQYKRFETLYKTWFTDPLDDGFALLHHDAAGMAFAAVSMIGAIQPTAADVAVNLRSGWFAGATGALSVGTDGSPRGRALSVHEFPPR
ncbi:NACHT domain-containing protein [Lentzea sp. NPDC058450]|uniref:NACHT domain-containing protein n=1 Tax=Lentzea sp. NPDC058450 TaxID=3346505 RepID=UPI0036471E0C